MQRQDCGQKPEAQGRGHRAAGDPGRKAHRGRAAGYSAGDRLRGLPSAGGQQAQGHGGAPVNPDGTLVNALLWHCKGSLSGIGSEIRPGIVHRIDKDTSGLLVVAKDDATHIGLSQQMAVHSVERAYQTVVYGGFAQDEGFVEANLGRSKTDRKKMAVYPASEPHTKYAYTGYKVLERLGEFTLLECRLKTGRTHQIRVHMASIHHPVAGDPVYGPHNCITSLHGQCLHAKTLGFVHPITGEQLRFDSELPDYFTHFLATLRRKNT